MSLMAAGRIAEIFLPVRVTHTDALYSLAILFSGGSPAPDEINLSVIAAADETKQVPFLFVFPQTLLFSACICSVHMWLP